MRKVKLFVVAVILASSVMVVGGTPAQAHGSCSVAAYTPYWTGIWPREVTGDLQGRCFDASGNPITHARLEIQGWIQKYVNGGWYRTAGSDIVTSTQYGVSSIAIQPYHTCQSKDATRSYRTHLAYFQVYNSSNVLVHSFGSLNSASANFLCT